MNSQNKAYSIWRIDNGLEWGWWKIRLNIVYCVAEVLWTIARPRIPIHPSIHPSISDVIWPKGFILCQTLPTASMFINCFLDGGWCRYNPESKLHEFRNERLGWEKSWWALQCCGTGHVCLADVICILLGGQRSQPRFGSYTCQLKCLFFNHRPWNSYVLKIITVILINGWS